MKKHVDGSAFAGLRIGWCLPAVFFLSSQALAENTGQPLVTETHFFLIDASQLGQHWDSAFNELVERHDRLVTKGFNVGLWAISNGSYPVVLRPKPGGGKELERKVKDKFTGQSDYSTQTYRAFGEAFDIWKEHVKDQQRVNVVIWCSNRATESIFHSAYSSEAVLQRYRSFRQEHLHFESLVSVTWKVYGGEPEPRLKDFIDQTKCEREADTCVVTSGDAPLSVTLPPPGEGRSIITPPVKLNVKASKSLALARVRFRDPIATLNGKPVGLSSWNTLATLADEDVSLRLSFNPGQLVEGKNQVQIQLSAQLAEAEVQATASIVIEASFPPVEVAVAPDPKDGPPSFILERPAGNAALKDAVPANGEFRVSVTNLGPAEKMQLNATLENAPGLTVRIREKGNAAGPDSTITVDSRQATRFFELLLDGTLPLSQALDKAVEFKIVVEIAPPRSKRVRVPFNVIVPMRPHVKVSLTQPTCDFFPGDQHTVMLLKLLPPEDVAEVPLEIELADEAKSLLPKSFDSILLQDENGKPLDWGAQVVRKTGLTIMVVAKAAWDTQIDQDRKALRIGVKITPPSRVGIGGEERGKAVIYDNYVALLGPAIIDIQVVVPKVGELLVGEIVNLPVTITNTTPRRRLPKAAAVRISGRTAQARGQIEITSPSSTSQPEGGPAIVSVPEDDRSSEHILHLRALALGNLDQLTLVAEGIPDASIVFKGPDYPRRKEFLVGSVTVCEPYFSVGWKDQEMTVYPGGDHQIDNLLVIQGRTMDRLQLRAKVDSKGFTKIARIILEPVKGLGAVEGAPSISLTPGQAVDMTVPSQDTRVSESYAVHLVVDGEEPENKGASTRPALTTRSDTGNSTRAEHSQELAIRFQPVSAATARGVHDYSVKACVRRPTMGLEFVSQAPPPPGAVRCDGKFASLVSPRAWRGVFRLTGYDAWARYFESTPSQGPMESGLTVVARLESRPAALANLLIRPAIQQSSTEPIVNLQGQPIATWLDSGELLSLEIPAPVGYTIEATTCTFALQFKAPDGRAVISALGTVQTTLPELPSAPTPIWVKLLVGLLILLVVILVVHKLITTSRRLPMAGVLTEHDTNQEYHLTDFLMVIGSDPPGGIDGSLRLSGEGIAAQHARLEASGTPVAQGVYSSLPRLTPMAGQVRVNGETLSTKGRILQDEDTIEIGQTTLAYRITFMQAAEQRDETNLSSDYDAQDVLA